MGSRSLYGVEIMNKSDLFKSGCWLVVIGSFIELVALVSYTITNDILFTKYIFYGLVCAAIGLLLAHISGDNKNKSIEVKNNEV